MRKSTRLSVLAPLLVSSLAIGPAAFAQAPAADARVPAGTCKLQAGGYNNPSSLKLTGNGFPENTTVEIKSDGGYANSYKVPTGGNFQLNGLPYGTYTVAGTSCSGGGPAKQGDQQQPNTDAAKTEYDKGYRSGFQAVKDNCQAKPPQTAVPPDQNWTDGYNAGAALAAKTFCGGGQNTGTKDKKQEQHDAGYKKGYDTVQQTCNTSPPKTAVAPDPDWLQGYTEGAAAAAAKFCN
ncbi:hypothetical protein ACIPW5_25170 [Streptomyces sp. NPDC090077]|uniref:hypothetical protein n=1 Tax=Streptomyces sp. NPDC090077 TaxID=3365938 RepID=UPI00382818CF